MHMESLTVLCSDIVYAAVSAFLLDFHLHIHSMFSTVHFC